MNKTNSFIHPFVLMINDLKKSNGRIFRYAPLIVWIGVVLFASTGAASMSETSRFIRPLLHFLFPNTPEEILTVYHGCIRKLAHLTEYAVLAFLAARAFSKSSKNPLRNYWFVFAFFVVLVVACADESNQSFNPSRTGSPYDVLLDCTGGAWMILIFYLTKKFRNPRAANSKF